MRKTVRNSILIVFLFLAFILCLSLITKVKSDSLLVSGSNLSFHFANATASFQAYSYVEFECVSGEWNGTNANLTVRTHSGSLAFIPVDNCTLDIGTVSDRTMLVTASNATLIKINGNYSAAVLNGSRIVFTWRFLQWSLIDNYFMLGVGLTGIIMIVAAPTMLARTFIKTGLSDVTIEWIGYAMLMMIMGFGFLVVWLWQ